MPDRLSDLDRAVAQAADAWMSAPQDWRVYSFLVEAVLARRAYVQPQLLDQEPPTTSAVADSTQPDEVLDGLADERPVAAVGELLHGDVDAVVQRLRQPAVSRD